MKEFLIIVCIFLLGGIFLELCKFEHTYKVTEDKKDSVIIFDSTKIKYFMIHFIGTKQ